jgi:prepilin-type N-terminal cleavage/methylation domain-containing protein
MIAFTAHSKRARAFSLIELLVVMVVIGLLASIGLPALRGLSGGNDTGTAVRQLLDDLAYARMKAINDRTTVYVVFASDQILRQPWNQQQRKEVTRLAHLQYTSYLLFARRSLGDQPGPGMPRYITDWRTLPDGVFVSTNKFSYADEPNAELLPLATRPLPHVLIPFPQATNSTGVPLPVIAFDYQGRLASHRSDIILPITRGSLVFQQEQDPNSLASAEVIETPRNNFTNNPAIRIDWLTGRARVVQPEKMNYAALNF